MSLYAVRLQDADVSVDFVKTTTARFFFILFAAVCCASYAQAATLESCPQPEIGSAVEQPAKVDSAGGELRVALRMRSEVDARGRVRYCYVSADGKLAPTLRLNPGDWLVVEFKNEITPAVAHTDGQKTPMAMRNVAAKTDPCAGGIMIDGATNLHFHGLAVPPVCHQDEAMHTMIEPGAPTFEYRMRIPENTRAGLYWYHPHPHGFTKAQVLGGASGALIVEGIERANSLTAGLSERVLVIRDQELMNPDAVPVASESMPPPIVLRDAEGDILNNGTGGGKPAKDLSVNFVTVPFPEYRPATVRMRAGQRELWRVLNASAITYLDLQVLFAGKAQALGVVALDGEPTNLLTGKAEIKWQSNALIPPAGRVEFIVSGPPQGIAASLVTRTVDTGPAGENDPTRPLIAISSGSAAQGISRTLPNASGSASSVLLASTSLSKLPYRPAWLGEVKPVRTRKLFFYEEADDPKDPNSPTKFYITLEGHANKQFDPQQTAPNMVVQQGTVEDWIIENRTKELHAFHIHQVQFLLEDWNGVPVNEPFLLDTVNVPYWDGFSPVYPSVRLRMDFRDPAIVGTFPYHCHLLEHEDGGMMGTVRVESSQENFKQHKSPVK